MATVINPASEITRAGTESRAAANKSQEHVPAMKEGGLYFKRYRSVVSEIKQ